LLTRASRIACYEHRFARALSLSRLIFQPVAAGVVDLGLTFRGDYCIEISEQYQCLAANHGQWDGRMQFMASSKTNDVNFYSVCDDQE
jgi:hypothetical protein